MNRLLVIVIIVLLVFVSITYILHEIFKKNRFVKYLPALIALIIAVFGVLEARLGQREGFRDLAAMLVAIIFFAGSLSGFLTASYIDYSSLKIK